MIPVPAAAAKNIKNAVEKQADNPADSGIGLPARAALRIFNEDLIWKAE